MLPFPNFTNGELFFLLLKGQFITPKAQKLTIIRGPKYTSQYHSRANKIGFLWSTSPLEFAHCICSAYYAHTFELSREILQFFQFSFIAPFWKFYVLLQSMLYIWCSCLLLPLCCLEMEASTFLSSFYIHDDCSNCHNKNFKPSLNFGLRNWRQKWQRGIKVCTRYAGC